MKYAFRSAVLFASVFIIVKLIFFNAGWHGKYYPLIIFINILLVLLAMVTGLWSEGKYTKPKRAYLEIVKSCLRPAAWYIILVTGFVFLYYSVIDKEYTKNLIEQRMEAVEKADFKKIQENSVEYKDKTRDDFIDNEREYAEKIFSPFAVSTFTLFGMLLLSFFYSLVIAYVYKRFFINNLT